MYDTDPFDVIHATPTNCEYVKVQFKIIALLFLKAENAQLTN